jgi:hypothetical protein
MNPHQLAARAAEKIAEYAVNCCGGGHPHSPLWPDQFATTLIPEITAIILAEINAGEKEKP